MKLSIIITTRNRKEDLLSCVKSIKKATSFNLDWELIIVDDNSNDGTEKIRFDGLEISNGKIIRNNEQQMMVRSRNIGAKEAKGECIMFIDDDNIVDDNMFKILLEFAENDHSYGIIGPTMHFLENKKKYLDFQKINFFTGKTVGKIAESEKEVCASDGIPNAFLIKKEVFDECGFFDEQLIQTFTEPDFSFNALRFGYKCGIVKKAKIYHNVSSCDSMKPRALGGQFSQKAYCLMRNRTVIISRYGEWHQRIIYLLFFSWFWPLAYSILMLKEKKFDLIKLYWRGFFDGIIYFFTGKLKNSLKKNKKSFMILKDTFKKMRKKTFDEIIIKTFFSLTHNEYENVLDVGCGKGIWAYLGAKKGKFKRVSACDIFDDFQFEEIQRILNNVEYKHIDKKTLPFEDNVFDLVFSMDVIEHVKDDLAFILEKIRVAKSGGKILIGTPNYFRIGNFPLIITGKLKYPRNLGHDSYGDVIHLREYKKNELNKLLNKVANLIDSKSICIHACFLGIPAFNIGLEKFPKILEKFCQYWFISFNKK